jgi:tetratricopeptide (TPR) repeat protein
MIPPRSMQTTKKHPAKPSPGGIFGCGTEPPLGAGGMGIGDRRWVVAPCIIVLVIGVVLTACTPGGPRAVLDGKRLLERGDFAQAAEEFQIATQLMPTNAIAFNYLGLALHQAGQSAEAERAYLHALSLDHDLTEVHYDLGCLWLNQSNKVEQAKSALTAYTMRRPGNPDGWLKLGQAQLRNREFAAADRSLEEALRLDPHNPDTLTSLGLVRYQRKRSVEAAQMFARALKEQPNYGPALLNAAIVAQEQNDLRPALQRYREYAALKPPPDNLPAVLSLVHQLDQQLNPPVREVPTNHIIAAASPVTNAPRPAFAETVHPGPAPKPATVTNMARLGSATRAEPPANSARPQTQAISPRPAPPTNSMPADKLPVERLAAEPVIKPAEDVGAVTNPHLAPGQAASELPSTSNRSAQPRSPAKRTLLQRLNPINLFAHDEVAPSASNRTSGSGNAPNPVANSTNSNGTLASNPEAKKFPRYSYLSPEKPPSGDRSSAETVFAQGVQLQQARRLSDAVQAYRRAAQLDPSFYNAHYNLGLAASENGNSTLALSAYQTALAIDPQSLDARYNFGLVLKQTGYVLDAVTQFDKILEQYPNEPRAHLALGNIYAQQLQDPATAREHYKAVLASAPQSPQAGAIRYWLSDHPH